MLHGSARQPDSVLRLARRPLLPVSWLMTEILHAKGGLGLQVMTMVKRLVKTGITVCATIHSPTPYGGALLLSETVVNPSWN